MRPGKFSIIVLLLLIVVMRAGAQAQPPRERVELYNTVEDASELQPGENAEEKIRKNFFLRAELTKTSCFVGEPVMATFKAYSRLDANSQVVKRPSLSGFSVVEMVDAYNSQPDVEKFNGEFYYVHLIRKVQLFPLQPGDFIIEPAEVESVIQLRKSEDRNSRIRFKNLFKREKKDPNLLRQVIFKTPEVAIHVNPLPKDKQPEDFSGAVGNFRLELSIDDSSAIQHQASKVILKIIGSGNFPLITDPYIEWPKGIDVPPPIVNEEVNKYEFPLAGIKWFEYAVDNSDTGSFTIPAVHLSYFDPESKTYKTASSSPLHYSVSESKNADKSIPFITPVRNDGIPQHYYYFGVVVLVIIGVIIYMVVKKVKKDL